MSGMTDGVTVSIVSHGHGEMVVRLVGQLLACPEIVHLILTLNVPEALMVPDNARLTVLRNTSPKGFGANHNAAFRLNRNRFFCVLNPDVTLLENPFPLLMSSWQEGDGVAAPLVVNPQGLPEDSMRVFITPFSLLKRILGFDLGAYPLHPGDRNFHPDWVAGMFMLFDERAYAAVQGFDERYFMYCEDADICTRLWRSGYRVVGCQSASVVHEARRASFKKTRHLVWHLRSMARYVLTQSFRLPGRGCRMSGV